MTRTPPLRLVLAAVVPLLLVTPAHALSPKTPQRPMNAQTCAEAFDRLEEAARGSPLVSVEANRRILLDAIAQARRLCVADKPAG